MKLLAKLDSNKGMGLIERERVKQGQDKPAWMYVLHFTTQELPPQPENELEPSMPCPEVNFDDMQEKSICRLPPSKCLDFFKGDGNYPKKNYTEFSYINPPHQS